MVKWGIPKNLAKYNSDALTLTNYTLCTGKNSSLQVFHCRHSRKKGYNCTSKVRLMFSEADNSVIVQEVGGEHNHEIVIGEEQEGENLRWTAGQTNMAMTGVLNEAQLSSGAT